MHRTNLSYVHQTQRAGLAHCAAFIAALILSVSPVRADQQASGFEITSFRFDGNDSYSNRELQLQCQTRETPGFFGKFFYGINERFGSKNEYLDESVLGDDASRLRQFYRDRGFQDVAVDTLLSFFLKDSTVKVLIRIREGYRSLIDTLSIRGLAGTPEIVHEEVSSGQKIVRGDPFNKALVEEEVKRILQILKNDGYAQASFARDSSHMAYYTGSRNYSVVLTFDPGKFYRFGDITVSQEQEIVREDITDDDVIHQLDYKTGEAYSLENLRFSERNLNRLGIFDRAYIETHFPTADSLSDLVTTTIKVRPRDKHELAPEILFGSDENNNFSLGSGLAYTDRNFFGGGRISTTSLRFRTQNFKDFPDVFNANNNAVANANLTFEVVQPYVFSNKIKGDWSFSAIADKQMFYINRILQNKFGFTDRFAEFTTGYLEWTMQLVRLEKKSHIVVDSSNAESLRGLYDLQLQDSLQQFNSILAFTIQRDMTNDVFSPSKGFVHSFTIEESGLLPLALKKVIRDLPFTQFYRASFLLRWYLDITGDSRFSILAFKLKGGYEAKYGESASDSTRTIPQTHRFYAGGGGSVRGWHSRELSATGDPQLGGNVLAEASMELRTNVFQSLKDDFWDRIWTVLFLDMGNVWPEAKNLNIRGTAVAAGLGLRYDTLFGPFRIDYGLQIYDPQGSVNGKHWVTQRKFWGETLRIGVLSFGIGHAF